MGPQRDFTQCRQVWTKLQDENHEKRFASLHSADDLQNTVCPFLHKYIPAVSIKERGDHPAGKKQDVL